MLWKYELEDFSDESCALKLVENVALPTMRLYLGIPIFPKNSSKTQRLVASQVRPEAWRSG